MKSAYDVKGKNVIVTGGNRGIGRGIVQAFAESGANVAIFCRNVESGEKAVAEIAEFGGKNAVFKCDISDYESVKAAIAEVCDFYGSVDVLVNNAGVATHEPFISENGLKEWYRVIGTDLHGPANMIFEIVPKMIEAGKGGVILNISSVAGMRVSNAPYNAAKAGLDIFSRYLAVNLGEYGIRVNSILPGPIHSDLDSGLPPKIVDLIKNELPAHRFGEPIEVGALCVYLASPAGAMVTAANWTFDGGMANVR